MTLAAELVARLRARGATIRPDGDALVIRPAAVVQPDEVPVLREHKAEILALLSQPASSALASWPVALSGLGARVVIAFTACADCESDPPDDDRMKFGSEWFDVPGQRGTFVSYGDVPLCLRHARAWAGEAGR